MTTTGSDFFRARRQRGEVHLQPQGKHGGETNGEGHGRRDGHPRRGFQGLPEARDYALGGGLETVCVNPIIDTQKGGNGNVKETVANVPNRYYPVVNGEAAVVIRDNGLQQPPAGGSTKEAMVIPPRSGREDAIPWP